MRGVESSSEIRQLPNKLNSDLLVISHTKNLEATNTSTRINMTRKVMANKDSEYVESRTQQKWSDTEDGRFQKAKEWQRVQSL